MKKTLATTAMLLTLGFAGTAAADCTVGDPPTVPDGTSATEAEMVSAQQAIKAYVAETQEFLQCIEFESKGRPTGDATRRYNEASERMEKLASNFNKQLKVFKSR
ncbi:hypothetical protein [Rhodospirillum centenum]|uniref:Lipoprotein n=1 Tax=Rhodospirillum centenum (strain ATCC 51521 / SW) TaxID=414684 RepID=B6IX98_RHOCS|nr:hypothetical protein [Rhodospirillum centenum]ACJ00922.1 hypothetical protein RC1_3569 [Rhodospirillum centenum SW]